MTRRLVLTLALLAACVPSVDGQTGITTARLAFIPSAQTCASNGGGTAAALTVTTNGKSYVVLTQSDPDGCVLTLSETGAKDGQWFTVVNVSANSATVADSSGVQELRAGATLTLAQYEATTFVYRSDRWVQVPSASQPYDAEAIGNTLTIPFTLWWKAGVVDGGAYETEWSMHTSATDAPTDIINGSTATLFSTLRFDDSATESIYHVFLLPSDWSGAIDVKIFWTTTATSGNVVWQVATFCAADNETSDPSTFTYNTAQTITDAAKGTTVLYNTASQTGLTTTGCAAGELLFLKLFRNPAHASDTIATDADFHGLQFTYRRAI